MQGSLVLILGSGCFMAWITAMQYLDYFNSIHIATRVMRRSLPEFIRFFICIIPIFMAFLFLGATMFNNTFHF